MFPVRQLAYTVILLTMTVSVKTRSASGPAATDTSSTFQNFNSILVQENRKFDNLAENRDASDKKSQSTTLNDFSLMYRIYQQCAGENLSVCLKVKLLTGLEKAFRSSKELKIIDGVQFVSLDDKPILPDSQSTLMSEKDIEAVLPRSSEGKEQMLNNMILNKLTSFLDNYTLQVKFPNEQDVQRSLTEGRKKKDKKGSGAYIMIPLLLGGTFIPIAYGALAMLAGKALIVSKLALVLASIIGIKKLLGGGEHKESQHEVVVSSGSHGSGWGREFDLAYNAHNPKDLNRDI